MPLNGTFSTMPLPDLLEWVARAHKTATLKVEHDNVCRRVQFDRGRVVGCASDDPPALLGQYLLSHGHITRSQLRRALERQEDSGERISDILIEMGLLTEEEVDAVLAAKVDETLLGLFDWQEAAFHLTEQCEKDPYLVQVDLKVPDLLFRGLRRANKMKQFRSVFHDPGIVLERTGSPPPPELAENCLAEGLLAAIDGHRTLAEIFLHAHASEFEATRLLFELHRARSIEIGRVRSISSEQATIHESEQSDSAAGPEPEAVAEPESVDQALRRPSPESELAAEISMAVRLMDRGHHVAALRILRASRDSHPGEPILRELIDRAEAEATRPGERKLTLDMIPRLTVEPDELTGDDLSPEVSFLPSLIDGQNSIKSILWLAPMRGLDVVNALNVMVEKGLVELHEPVSALTR